MNDETIDVNGETFKILRAYPGGTKIEVAWARLNGKVVGYNVYTRHWLIQQHDGSYFVASDRFLFEAGYAL